MRTRSRLIMYCRQLMKVQGRLRMVGQALKRVGEVYVFILSRHTRKPKRQHKKFSWLWFGKLYPVFVQEF
jgi:hypothetical protein